MTADYRLGSLPLEFGPAQDDRRMAGGAEAAVRRRADGTSTRRPASPSTAPAPSERPATSRRSMSASSAPASQSTHARRFYRQVQLGRARGPGPRTVPRL